MPELIPRSVLFHTDSIFRTRSETERCDGDNWCITWSADDSQVTNMDDGDWLGSRESDTHRRGFHNRLYRIIGPETEFERQELHGYPEFAGPEGSWFGYGIISVDGTLYSAISKTPGNAWSGPFRGVKLLKSIDAGESWSRIDASGRERLLSPMDEARNRDDAAEMFSLEVSGRPHQEQVAYPFSYFDFVQHGRDNTLARDAFVYVVGPEGASAHRLLLARVGKTQIGNRDDWQYYAGSTDGEPVWSTDIEQRQPMHIFPDRNSQDEYFGWYSWLPSIVWNEGLGLYIMVNGGTYAGHGMSDSDEDYYDSWMHTRTGSLGFWYAEKPWGPWQPIFYAEKWTADDPQNLTYQPKLSPKWISDDGKRMVLIWSDAMRNAEGKSHTVNYTWNQMSITLQP